VKRTKRERLENEKDTNEKNKARREGENKMRE
jgi:hypothetical protein